MATSGGLKPGTPGSLNTRTDARRSGRHVRGHDDRHQRVRIRAIRSVSRWRTAQASSGSRATRRALPRSSRQSRQATSGFH